MKVRRSIYNLIFGFGRLIITFALGIIIPRLFLINFGSEINGLLSSISQVFVYLVLFEAGVGTASIQALYKPILKQDKYCINSVLSATSIYYKKTGLYYFFAVLTFSIIYPFVINSNLNKITVMSIILLSGMSGVINYFFSEKYKLLLTAKGKEYINTSITLVIYILNNIMKIILILKGFNIIVIYISYLIISILQVVAITMYVKKNYKWIDLNVKPNFDSISQKNSVLLHQISGLIFSSTDILILTIFCGLKVVSVYVIYTMVFGIINSISDIVISSVSFVLGQTYHEGKEKYVKLYDSYELYYTSFVFSLFVVVYILIIPFIKLYTAGVSDINYIDYLLPVFFVSLNLLSCARTPACNPIKVAGHFKKTQMQAILESVINIICSLIFVNLFGIYGVLMGTIAALLYRSIDIVIYANRKILNRNPWITIRRWLIDITLFLIIIYISNIIKINPTSYTGILITGVILTIIITPVYFIISSLFERDTFKFTFSFFKIYLDRFLTDRKLISHED